jgi:hypothetical protein
MAVNTCLSTVPGHVLQHWKVWGQTSHCSTNSISFELFWFWTDVEIISQIWASLNKMNCELMLTYDTPAHISWEAFLDPSDSYFLFADFVDFYSHWTYILYRPIFSRIFLSNYWWQRSDIWSQASYRYPISWEAFFDPSDSYFLFTEEREYHKWALAHSSSCLSLKINKVGKQEVGIWWVQKRFPRYVVPIWSLWPNIRSLPSIVAEKNVTHFWTHQIPISCLSILLIFIHI